MKKSGYNIINVLVMLITAVWFFYTYIGIIDGLRREDTMTIVLLLLTVIGVHGIKALRLYFSLYGTTLRGKEYFKTYCKVTPVSIVLPFKVGELFRMYCYGGQLNNYLKGAVIVLLDRFMDTIALVTVMFLVWVIEGGPISIITYGLLIFSVMLVLIYYVFPRIYGFWKTYLLHADATKNRIRLLKLLERCQALYAEVKSVVNGRGIILYVLSILAWTIEIGSMLIVTQLGSGLNKGTVVSEYLRSAITGEYSMFLNQFIFVSVVGLALLYLLLKASDKLHQGKEDNR